MNYEDYQHLLFEGMSDYLLALEKPLCSLRRLAKEQHYHLMH